MVVVLGWLWLHCGHSRVPHRCATNSSAPPLYASPARSSRWKSSVQRMTTAPRKRQRSNPSGHRHVRPFLSVLAQFPIPCFERSRKKKVPWPWANSALAVVPVSLQFFLKDSSVRPRQTPAHGTRGEKHGPPRP
jgi:hypothetical protein